MDLRHLRYFVATAEELHFGRAAERLHVAQPALSRQIIALERELNLKLFDRGHQRVALTRAGEAFLEEARAVLDRAVRAEWVAKRIADGEVGRFEVGFVTPAMWYVLPPILREHRSRQPDVRVGLHELGLDVQLELLLSGTLDLAFVRPPILDDRLAAETVWRDPIVVALSERHQLAGADTIDLADLADETFVTVPRTESPLQDLYRSICLEHGFSPVFNEQATTPAATQMIAAGLGISLAGASTESAALPGVVFRPLRGVSVELELIACRRADDDSPMLHAFLETVRQVVPGLARH